MKPLDYVLLAVLVLIIGAAVYFTIRNRRHGHGCGGSCGGDCENCPMRPKKNPKSPDDRKS